MKTDSRPLSAIFMGGNPARYHANLKLKRFFNKNKINKPSACPLCCKPTRIDAHHPDYENPEVFVWVCRSCHLKIHAGQLVLLEHRDSIIYPKGYWKEYWNRPENLPIYAKALRRYLGRWPDWFIKEHPEYKRRK